MRRYLKAAIIGLAALGMTSTASADNVIVGGKNFTEQQLLTAITGQLLTDNGYTVDSRGGMGSTAVRQAMENGQIDIYWEYTGTSLITYNNIEERLDADTTYARVKELDAEKGIVWLDPSAANNTYALAMRRTDAEERGIATLSDLAGAINGGEVLTFASNAEFYARSDGLSPLQETYGFEFGRPNIQRMDSGLVYQALRDSLVEVGLVFATDGRIPAFDFVVLADNLEYFPSYALAPVIRQEVLDANPELGDLLNSVSASLNDEVMARLNARVDVDGISIENVASEFLAAEGLI